MTSPLPHTPSRPWPSVPPWTTHPAELDLLLACARSDATGQEARIRRLAATDLDWAFLTDESAVHGIDAMLYHHLHRLAPEAMPLAVRETLRARSERLLASNLYRLGVLLRLVEALRAHDVPVLTFKGPLLALQQYGNLGFRDFVDVDLLVPRPALDRARTVLQHEGFVPAVDRSPEAERAALDAQLGLEFVRERDEVWVELHWALLNKTFAYLPDPDGLWARAVEHPVGPASVAGLSPEDLLLYLCAHGTKHHWASLKWLCDVAQVCRTTPLDWDVLLDRADQLDADRMLALGLHLAVRWLDAPVPPVVQTRLFADRPTLRLARHVETHWLFRDAGFDRTPRWDQFWFFLRSRRHWRSHLSLVREYGGLALAPTENDTAFCPLPPRLSALYYVVRPIRLLNDAIRATVGRRPSPAEEAG